MNTNTAHAAAGINRQMNFQGRLFTNGGAVIPDGDYNMEFKLVEGGDGCNPSSGTFPCDGDVIWTETRTDGDKVRIRNGYFSVQLGSVDPLTDDMLDDDTLWLSMNIGGTGSPDWDGEMKPLKRLSASPYAFNAGRLGGLSTADLIQNTTSLQADSNFHISGTGVADTALQAPAIDTATAATLGIGATNATAVNIGKTGSNITTTITGLTVIKPSSGNDSTTAFQVQNGAGATLFTADTANNRLYVGDADNSSSANTTLLVVDSASTSNLPVGVAGGLVYDTTLGQLLVYSGGEYKIFCTEEDANCGGPGGGSDLQGAYDAGNIITTTNASDLVITLADTATDANFLIDIETGSTGRFALQANGTDTFSVNGTGQVLLQNSSNSTTAFQVQNVGGDTVFNVDTDNQRAGIGTNTPLRTLHVAVDNSTTTGLPLLVEQHGSGDVGLEVKNLAQSFYIGIDSSDNNTFKISSSTAASATAILGNNTSAGTVDENNFAAVNTTEAVALISGTIDSLHAYVNTTGAGGSSAQVAVYANSGGKPAGTPLIISDEITLENGAAWNTFTFPSSLSVTQGTTYWLAYATNGDNNLVYTSGPMGSSCWQEFAYSTGDFADMGAGDCNQSIAHYAIYAVIQQEEGATDSLNAGLFTLTATGAATFQNFENSTAAFQIQNAAGTSDLFVADTINTRIGIGMAPDAGGARLQVGGNILSTGNIEVAGAIIGNTIYSSANYQVPMEPTTFGTVNIGDVVIYNDIDEKYTTTTTPRDPRVAGVNVVNWTNMAISGKATLNVDSGAVAIGDQLVTSSTAGAATVDNSATTGIVGRALSSKAGGSPGQVTVQLQIIGGQPSPRFQNLADSTTAFQIQNQAGTSNLFVADTTNTRIGIGLASPQATLHVSASGSGGDLFRITDTTATAQDVVKVADGGAVTFRNQTDSTAAFQIQNAAGDSVFKVDSTNKVVGMGLIDANHRISFDVDTGYTQFNIQQSSSERGAIIMGNEGGSPAIRMLDYFGNGAVVLRQAVSNQSYPTANGGLGICTGVSNACDAAYNQLEIVAGTGAAAFRNISNSTAAFQIQNAAGTSLFTVDTSNSAVSVSGSGGLTLGVAGSTTGNLYLANSSSSRMVILQGLNPSGTGNATIQIPTIAGGNTDTVCLATLANCTGSSLATTLAGAGLVGNGAALDIGAGTGITVGANSISIDTSAGLTWSSNQTFSSGLTINSQTFTDLTGDGLTISSGALTIAVAASSNGLSATTSSGSGLEVLSSGLALLQGCSDGQILKWNESSDVWACANDNVGEGGEGETPDLDAVYAADSDKVLEIDYQGLAFNLLSSAQFSIQNDGDPFFTVSNAGLLFRSPFDTAGAFQIQNSIGAAMLDVDTDAETVRVGGSGGLLLGYDSGLDGTLGFYNSSNSNIASIQSGATSSSYTLTLPTALPGSDQCLQSSNAGALSFTACGGGGGTLATSYSGGSSQTDNTIVLDSTRLGVRIQDASSPISGNLFAIQSSSAAATFLGVTTSAVTMQDSSGNDAFVFDLSNSIVKVFENVSSPSNYAQMYYASGEAVFAASSGATRVGSGSGNITMALTGNSDVLTFSKTSTPAANYTATDFTITRNLTGTNYALQGSVLKVEDLSSFTGGSSSPNMVVINQNNSSATGNLINGQLAGSSKFTVSTAGTVTIASGQSYTGAGALTLDSASGTQLSIGTGANAHNVVVGNSTGSTGLTFASGSGGISLTSTSGNITIGASDSTGTLVVLDTDSDATFSAGSASNAPAAIDGAMFYSSTSHTFMCGVAGSWQTCNGLLYSNTAASAAINTCTNACAAFDKSVPIPANYCQAGRTIRLVARGHYSTTSTPTIIMSLYYGTDGSVRGNNAQIGSSTNTSATLSSASNWGWYYDVTIICFSTTSMMAQGTLYLQTNSTTGSNVLMATANAATTSLTTNSAKNLYIFPTWSASSGSNSVVLNQLIATGN